MTDSVNLRAVVLDILMEINEKGEFSHLLINNALTKYQYLDKNKRAFISRLSLGTIENRIELDYIIDQFSKTPVRKMKPLIRNICEMSVYQIIYMDNIPDSAVCNEAVKLATKRGFTGLKGFVNGVLRNIARNKDNITYPDRNKDIEQYLSVKYSMPLWIVKMWHSQLGIDKTEKILAALTLLPPGAAHTSITVSPALNPVIYPAVMELISCIWYRPSLKLLSPAI